MLILELLGTFFGAGFASGREIASFFARFSIWGYAGALLASVVMYWLLNTEIPEEWLGKWPLLLWKTLNILLLASTGGAMLSAAGETVALVFPIPVAAWWGMFLTLALSWLLAFYIRKGLAWTSAMMLAVYSVVVVVGFTSLKSEVVTLNQTKPIAAISSAICYSGFNAALLLPVVSSSPSLHSQKKHSLKLMSMLTLVFLAAGIVVLHRNPALIDESMPFVKLLNMHGKWGYLLSACCLYMAALSTLTSCIKNLGRHGRTVIGIVGIAILGFSRIVTYLYTALGGVCTLVILMAKFRNCSRKSFISRRDML